MWFSTRPRFCQGARSNNNGWLLELVVFILTLTVIGGGFCFAEESYTGRVRDISDREYEQAVIELIDNAKESVVIGMYHIETVEKLVVAGFSLRYVAQPKGCGYHM